MVHFVVLVLVLVVLGMFLFTLASSSCLPLLLPVLKQPPRTTNITTRTTKTNAGTIRNGLGQLETCSLYAILSEQMPVITFTSW